jgi:hypothetical protein
VRPTLNRVDVVCVGVEIFLILFVVLNRDLDCQTIALTFYIDRRFVKWAFCSIDMLDKTFNSTLVEKLLSFSNPLIDNDNSKTRI